MQRPEPDNPAEHRAAVDGVETPEGRLDATADVIAHDLLACGFGERILVLGAGTAESDLDRAFASRVADRKGSVRTVALPADRVEAERQLARTLAEDLPEAIVNRSSHPIAAWSCVGLALAGGSRLLELPGLDDAALDRCLVGIDLGSLRWRAVAMTRRLDPAGTGRRGGHASDFLAAPLMRGSVASLPGAVAVPIDAGTRLVGLHPTARTDASPLERSRSLGTVSTLDPAGNVVATETRATLAIGGIGVVRDGELIGRGGDSETGLDDEKRHEVSRPRRRGRLARTIDSATRLLGRMPFRTFAAGGGRIAVAGPLAAQAAWLRALTGQPVGRIEATGSFLGGGLRRRLRPDDVVVSALGGPRSRLERIGEREAGWFTVPTYARMVIPLAGLREKGLEAFTAASESAKEPLRYIRTKRLGWRTVAADPESVRLFESRYHVPTMVDRHGPEAAIRPPAELLGECGRAEFLEIIHEGQAVGMSLFRPTSPRAELLQIGVLDGDEKWLKMRILSLCYALPALQCAQREIEAFDLGRSPPFPWHPVLNFKSKWGAAVDAGGASDRLLVRLPAASPATWNLLTRSGLLAQRCDGRTVAIVAVDAACELARLREVALPGIEEIVVVHDGVGTDAVASALEGVRNPKPLRFVPRSDLDRLAAIVG